LQEIKVGQARIMLNFTSVILKGVGRKISRRKGNGKTKTEK